MYDIPKYHKLEIFMEYQSWRCNKKTFAYTFD